MIPGTWRAVSRPSPLVSISFTLCHFRKSVCSVLAPHSFPNSWLWPPVAAVPCFHSATEHEVVAWPSDWPSGDWAYSLGGCFVPAVEESWGALQRALSGLILAVLLFWKTTEQWNGRDFISLERPCSTLGTRISSAQGRIIWTRSLSACLGTRPCIKTKTSTKKRVT